MPETKSWANQAETPMEPEKKCRWPDERSQKTPRSWVLDGYWEDELMQFAQWGESDQKDQPDDEPWQEMDSPLAASEF